MSINLKKNNPINLIIFSSFLILLVMLSVSAFFYQRRYNIEVNQFKAREQERLSILDEFIVDSLEDMKSDLISISSSKHLHNLLESDSKIERDLYTNFLLALGKNKQVYDQIRYIDETGKEIIRINYRGGLSYIVSEDQLQDKSKKYYFNETMMIENQDVFVSNLDLNVERGEIEKPFKPTIRIATPVMFEGEKKGIVILNYLAENIIKKLNFTLTEGDEQIYLVNQNGYWLVGPNKQVEWGFLFEDKKNNTLNNWNSELWEQISLNNNSQNLISEELFTTFTIYPDSIVNESTNGFYNFKKTDLDLKEESWTIISYLPKEIFLSETNLLARALIATNLLVFVVIIVTTIITSINIRDRIKAEKTISNLNNTLTIIAKILRHDLANMFNHIDISLDLFKENPKDKSVLKEIKKSTNNGIDIINQMKQLEGMVTSNKKLKKINVKDILNKIIQNYNIKINITGDGFVSADEAIENVFSNIINNSIRHGKTKSMDVKISVLKGKTIIKFIDYGIGLPNEVKKKVFEEGFKYGSTGNTGLGLYIVEQTIKRYGGKIWVEDNKPKGAIFVIKL